MICFKSKGDNFSFVDVKRKNVLIQPFANRLKARLGNYKNLVPAFTNKEQSRVVCVNKDLAIGQFKPTELIDIYQEQSQSKYAALWNSMFNIAFVTDFVKNFNPLLSIVEVVLKETQWQASDTEIVQFGQQVYSGHCVKGFGKVYKDV